MVCHCNAVSAATAGPAGPAGHDGVGQAFGRGSPCGSPPWKQSRRRWSPLGPTAGSIGRRRPLTATNRLVAASRPSGWAGSGRAPRPTGCLPDAIGGLPCRAAEAASDANGRVSGLGDRIGRPSGGNRDARRVGIPPCRAARPAAYSSSEQAEANKPTERGRPASSLRKTPSSRHKKGNVGGQVN